MKENNMEKTKDYLRIALIVASLVGAYALFNYASNYSLSVVSSSAPSLWISEEGKATAVPDIASFTFKVVTEGDTNIGSLQKNNTEKIDAAIDYIKSEGVDAKDITTLSYEITPRYRTYACTAGLYSAEVRVTACPPADIVGYAISQGVEVKVRDFEKIGGLLAGVVKNGANNVSNLSFRIDDLTDVQNQARAEAIKKAKEKAAGMAKAGGFRLGRLLSFNEDTPYYPVYYGKDMAMGMGGAETAAAPRIEAGSQEISVRVTLRYQIKN